MWSRGRGRNSARRGNMNFRGGPFRGGSPRGAFRGRPFNKPPRPYGKPQDKGPKRFDKPHFKKGVMERLNEEDIGITQYVNTLEGFNGVLKARYSDFQVNEIDNDGVVAQLTDLSVPKDPTPDPTEEDDEGLVNRYRIEELPIETWDKMHKMVQNSKKNECVEIDVTDTSKEGRTRIHEAVKTVFGPKIVGSTVTREDKKFIIFKKFNKHDKIDLREKWPTTRSGEYVYFLVHKEFTDTIEANIQISDSLQMRTASFCYAGVKDRRAKTTQWFCVRKVEPSKIVERTKNLKNIYVGNFCFKKETLKLGQLKGNRFRIAVRDVTADNELIEKALVSLRDNGFINYYGLQRFGNSKEIPTHTIGIELLRGNWAEAVRLILKPRKFEQMRDVGEAKLAYEESGDIAKAYALLKKNRNKCIEGKLLGGLHKHDAKDFVNALENVPRNMRLLYIHAYQSLVWNIMASRRIKEFGLKPTVGDIIVEAGQGSNPVWESVETDGTGKCEPDDESKEKDEKEQQIKIKILAESDLPNYTIYDVVLPLPGYDITYPGNEVKEWYKEYLEKDGLSLEMTKQKVKTYTLSGAYRKIVERVTNLSWKFMYYNDPVDTLIRSDIEELRGKSEPESIKDGKFKALVIDFCLSSSCYATMALRELMKINTSWPGPPGFKQIEEANETTVKTDDSIKTKDSIKTEDSIKTDDSIKTKDTPVLKKEIMETDQKRNTAEEKDQNEASDEYKPEQPTSETEDDNKAVKETENEPESDTLDKVVVTKEELQNAKKEFISKQIEELEDEIWSVMEKDSETLAGTKRKSESSVNKNPKRVKEAEISDKI